MNKINSNLQDVYINELRKEKIIVTVHLLNGFQLRGLIKGFDNFTFVLETEGKQMLIYKHAVSSITPTKSVNFSN